MNLLGDVHLADAPCFALRLSLGSRSDQSDDLTRVLRAITRVLQTDILLKAFSNASVQSKIYMDFYRLQRGWGKVIFSEASVILSTRGGCAWPGLCMARGHVWPGGCMHSWGACMAGGTCMAEGRGMHGGGCMHGRVHAWQGACVAGGMHGRGAFMAEGGLHGGGCAWGDVHGCVHGGHAWGTWGDIHTPPTPGRYYHYGIRSMSGRYASYWNAFLFSHLWFLNYFRTSC